MQCIHIACVVAKFQSYSFANPNIRERIPFVELRVLPQFHTYRKRDLTKYSSQISEVRWQRYDTGNDGSATASCGIDSTGGTVDIWEIMLLKEREDVASYSDLKVQHDKLFELLRSRGHPAINAWSSTFREVIEGVSMGRFPTIMTTIPLPTSSTDVRNPNAGEAFRRGLDLAIEHPTK